jgi:hypothetical protein
MRFSKAATTAVAAAGIAAVAVTAGFGSHAAVAATNPRQTSGLQLLSATVPAPQSAASVVAAFAAHATGATQGAPVVASHAPATPSKPAPAKAAPAKHATAKLAAVTLATAKPATAKPATAKPATVKPAKPKLAPVHHAAAPAKPYQIYDSTTPSVIHGNHQIATYANGAYAASPSSVAGRGHVLWIDTNGSDPKADALDVEPGDATPAGAAAWVQTKLNADHNHVAIVYTMKSQWQAVKDNVATLPHWMQDKVRYWIADPTGVDHVVPGSNATQWFWGTGSQNWDITTANPGFQS